MSDVLTSLSRLVALVFVPLMLLFPLVFVLSTPLRARGDAERLVARSRTGLLTLSSAIALVLWGGLLLASIRLPDGPLPAIAQFAWVLFFPLWFGFAMPAIRAKNPVWGGAMSGATASQTTVRTASLTPRGRERVIPRGAWLLAVVVCVGLLAGTAARGFQPFEDLANYPGYDAIARQRWIVTLAAHAVCALVTLIAIPLSIRRASTEPEPLDPGGSPELVELYRVQRQKRIRGLFWLLAVVLPGFLGALLCASTWLAERHGSTLGLVGGIGGSLLGLVGAAFGTAMAIQRVRIAETKARLESNERTA